MQPYTTTFDAAERIDTGPITMRVLVPTDATDGALALFEETTAPGSGPPMHVHRRQIETFRVVEGRYRFVVGDKTIEGGPGDVAVVPAGTPHAFVNVSDAPGRLMFLLTPGLKAEAMFRALAAPAAEGPPDPARLNRELAAYDIELVGPPIEA